MTAKEEPKGGQPLAEPEPAIDAGVALHHAAERLAFEARAQGLQNALASRDLIGQAKGILMSVKSISGDQAFDLLREASQQRNVKSATSPSTSLSAATCLPTPTPSTRTQPNEFSQTGD